MTDGYFNPEDTNREVNEVLNALEAIRAAVANLQPSELPRTTIYWIGSQATHARLMVRRLVLLCDTATNVTVTIGTEARVFPVAVGVPVDINFPRVIERGLNVSAVPGAGVLAAYLVVDSE